MEVQVTTQVLTLAKKKKKKKNHSTSTLPDILCLLFTKHHITQEGHQHFMVNEANILFPLRFSQLYHMYGVIRRVDSIKYNTPHLMSLDIHVADSELGRAELVCIIEEGKLEYRR